jgi:NADH:ubiquinone oxidoreductase subunit C
VNAYDRLPDAATEIFGAEAAAELAYDLLTVDVPAASWIAALLTARDQLGCSYFDWLSAVDEPGTGFRVCAHVVALADGRVRRLLIRTTVPQDAAVLPTAIEIYPGAGWHERETHEMFGISFTDHPNLVHLLLPETFEGHPLRKDFVLAARVAKAWPGAKEPGEPAAGAEHEGPRRRQMLPPGVPDPNEWGPLKGRLPPAASRPARAARPARRARSVSEGSASQQPEQAGAEESAPPTAPTPRTPDVPEGPAGQQQRQAPWHQPRPAFEDAPGQPATPGSPTPPVPAAAPGVPDAPATRGVPDAPATPSASEGESGDPERDRPGGEA